MSYQRVGGSLSSPRDIGDWSTGADGSARASSSPEGCGRPRADGRSGARGLLLGGDAGHDLVGLLGSVALGDQPLPKVALDLLLGGLVVAEVVLHLEDQAHELG